MEERSLAAVLPISVGDWPRAAARVAAVGEIETMLEHDEFECCVSAELLVSVEEAEFAERAGTARGGGRWGSFAGASGEACVKGDKTCLLVEGGARASRFRAVARICSISIYSAPHPTRWARTWAGIRIDFANEVGSSLLAAETFFPGRNADAKRTPTVFCTVPLEASYGGSEKSVRNCARNCPSVRRSVEGNAPVRRQAAHAFRPVLGSGWPGQRTLRLKHRWQALWRQKEGKAKH